MKKRCIILAIVVLVLSLVGNGFFQNRALFQAIQNSDLDAATKALNKGAFVDMPRHFLYAPNIIPTNSTPLITACKVGNSDMIGLLLEHGANVNLADKHCNETPLLAALSGDKANRFVLALYLIEQGAEVHAIQEADSVLYRSLLVFDTDNDQTIEDGFRLFQLLIEQNVDLSLPATKENVLTFAVHYQNYNAVKYLLENAFFSVDDTDDNGDTALIVAAKHDQTEIACLLLELGSDPTLMDRSGRTAMDYALESNNNDLIEALCSSSSNIV